MDAPSPAPAPAPAATPPLKPSISDAPSSTEHLTAEPSSRNQLGYRGLRLVGEMFGAGLAGGALAVTGAVIGCTLDQSGGMFACLGGLVIGASVGDFVGILAGTVLTGFLLDGNGSVAAVALGELLGVASGAALAIAFASGSSTDSTNSGMLAGVGGLAFLALPVLGAAIGYEVTSDFRRSLRAGHASLMPMLAPASRGSGALVGLSGSF